MVIIQFLFLASLLAVLIYSFKLPYHRKVFSSLLKVSGKKYDKLAAIVEENSELVKEIARANKEDRKAAEVKMQALIKRNEEARNSTRKALEELSESIERLIK